MYRSVYAQLYKKIHKKCQFNQLPRKFSFSPLKEGEITDLLKLFRKNGHIISTSCSSFPNHYMNYRNENENILKIFEKLKTRKNFEKFHKLYSETITVEFDYLPENEQNWLFHQYEENFKDVNNPAFIKDSILLLKCEAFDHFMAKKYTTTKRYGSEGCESVNIFYDTIIKECQLNEICNILWCMAHRGRLNTIQLILEYSLTEMFYKFNGLEEFNSDFCKPSLVKNENIPILTGDVLSHLFVTKNFDKKMSDAQLKVHLLPNSSHLEAVNSVALGMARGAQEQTDSLCLQVHGDGALIGQGSVMESLNMSQLDGFRVGGSIHLVINNLLSFTTESFEARSTRYCTDIAKLTSCPVIHVNGYNISGIKKAARLAMKYRNKFSKDIFVELVCFRKHGHNEMDEARFTNPLLYKQIDNKLSIPQYFFEHSKSAFTVDNLNFIKSSVDDYKAELNKSYKDVFSDTFKKTFKTYCKPQFAENVINRYRTGISIENMQTILNCSINYPKNFNIHPNLLKSLIVPKQKMLKKFNNDTKIDWPTAENLAVGGLLLNGFNVRICGQEAGRGTFSQRHAILNDQNTGERFIPFKYLKPGKFEIVNSPLSEFAVLGFEYGMSVQSRNRLVIWEAQFGDFANGAQIIIDAFISSGESKWGQQSSIVLLLPHGLDGMGSEHSSSRLERYLQLSNDLPDSISGDDVNMYIANPSTAAQYFHILRRQMISYIRKPLILMTPKALLKSTEMASPISQFQGENTFQSVLDDPRHNPNSKQNVKCAVLVSGKHFYTLNNERLKWDKNISNQMAILRIEQLCPFPVYEISKILKGYPNVKSYVWSQEEHQNNGPWSFVNERLSNILNLKLIYNGRNVSSSPASGIVKFHKLENEKILTDLYSNLAI
ncbi:hypothetical protein A3Q56_00126 [Intoshia linei]|uniref:Transketolase-like pyrimidine-binding domain-containing protein n=1 Tax=Intoshia linei TaxID=1819745 RepID=A0A177BET2_9BILA|nr:hypothetical protein A3Q56_00126 [Intoshia linei]